MKTIKTIQQHNTIYTISQLGNRSFRLFYTNNGEKRIQHVTTVFDTLEDVEEYIGTCANADKLISMVNK